jgi:nitronate monooxygenase
MPAAKQLPQALQNLALPVIASPMFIVSYPELVLAQCKAGIVGSFPALNARPAELLDEWLTQIEAELATFKAANPGAQVGPVAVNQIVHTSNARLEHDVKVCVDHKVPIFITSLRAPVKEMIDAVHSYGGIVLHDVISLGHAGMLSPFALVGEVRKIFDGPIALSGSIATGEAVLAAQAMGADFAYVGTRFIASQEAHAAETYKQSITSSAAADIIYTNLFTGVHGNYIRESISNVGLDPDNLPVADKSKMDFSSGASKAKAWKDVWGAGQGVGQIHDIPTAGEIVARMKAEYDAAKARLGIAR